MPIRYVPGGDQHDRDEYSFYTRDHGSRDFARSRRFGGEDVEEGRTMSLVSTPLQVPLIGKRRNVSPSRSRGHPPQQPLYEDDEEEYQEELRALKLKRGRSAENRHRYEYELDDYEPLQPLVPTYQPRVGRYQYRETRYDSSPPRRQVRRQQQQQQPQYDDEYEEEDVVRHQKHQDYEREPEQQEYRQPLPSRQQRQDEQIRSILNWRKRSQDPPLVHTDFGYELPPMRKRTDPELQNEEDSYRSVVGYIAKRKQFAVEDDDDMQYYKNPNYQYRMHGMDRPLVTDKDVEENMERNKLDRAPMFDMKIRSHVVWEKMKVKFTCTVRGSPKPRVTWYKDMVPIEPSLHSAGKYKISNNFGLHTLEISRSSIEDSGTYRVSMQNRKGEISSYATLLVRRYDGGRIGVVDMKSGYNLKKPTDYPDVEGYNIPEKKPHAGAIEVKEYDELPETDAAKYFRSQLENLDFDVKKLIKNAKFDRDISNADKGIVDVAGNMTSNIIDNASMKVQKENDDVTFDSPTKKTSEAFTDINGEKSYHYLVTDGGVSKGSESDVGSDRADPAKAKGQFKVAIDVTVTNETRRDSFETFEKLLERKGSAENGEQEKKPQVEHKTEAAAQQIEQTE